MIFRIAIVESRPSAFEHIQDMLVDDWILDGAARVGNTIAILAIDRGMNNLFGVANDRNVGIMGYHDDLPPVLHRADHWNEQMVDGLVVEIFFGLINNDRLIILIDQQIEHKKERPALPRRRLGQILAVQFQRIFRNEISERP